MNRRPLIVTGCIAVAATLGAGCSTVGNGTRAATQTAGQTVAIGGNVACSSAKLATTAGSSGLHTAWTLVSFPVKMIQHPLTTPFRTVADLTKTSVKLTKATVTTVGSIATQPGATKVVASHGLVKGAAAVTPHTAAGLAASQVGAPIVKEAILTTVAGL